MSNSSLVNYTRLSPNCTKPRNNAIKKITIHHMAANLTVEACGNVFAPKSRQASSNYGIGSDGRVGLYVEEKNRSWCSSSPSNDHQAVTIEVANDGGASTDWHVSDKALAKLIDLCVDICKRNGIKKLNYTGTTSGNLTRHNMFVNTTCPGPYLQGKLSYIANEVNKRLGNKTTTSTSTSSSSKVSVSTVQSKYNSKFGSTLGKISVDGIYGADTKKHLVKAVQYEMNKQYGSGLAVDGIFGSKSKSAFLNLRQGVSGNITWTCQAMLYCKGYNPNGLDSIYGPGMKSCVKTFQKNKGLAVDGILGKNTAYKLFN